MHVVVVGDYIHCTCFRKYITMIFSNSDLSLGWLPSCDGNLLFHSARYAGKIVLTVLYSQHYDYVAYFIYSCLVQFEYHT